MGLQLTSCLQKEEAKVIIHYSQETQEDATLVRYPGKALGFMEL